MTSRRALLADYAATGTAADAKRAAIAMPDWRHMPVAPGNRRLQELLQELTASCDQFQKQINHFGPGLAQSGLLALLELRLPDTYAHAQRVARSSVALAAAMDLPDSDVRAIRCAALLHDIGKIVVPARLLRQAGHLGDDEIAILRLHVTVGAELLAGIPSLAPVASIVGATHERFDGSGYPNRLMGSDIPLGARIIAVADCYDAMTAARPYADPVSREDAHNELVRCAGLHFDPAVVRAWVGMLGTIRHPVINDSTDTGRRARIIPIRPLTTTLSAQA
jgi:putative nucleotidyltransferase with HDIG domain